MPTIVEHLCATGLLLEIPSNNYARHVSCHHVMHPRPSLPFSAFSSPPGVLHLSFQASCWFSEDYKIIGIMNYKTKSSESMQYLQFMYQKTYKVGREELVKNKFPNLCQIIFQWDKFISDASESRISGSSFLFFFFFSAGVWRRLKLYDSYPMFSYNPTLVGKGQQSEWKIDV